MVHIRKRSHPHPTNFSPNARACRFGCNLNWSPNKLPEKKTHVWKGCTCIIRLMEKIQAPLRLPNFSSFFSNHSFFGTFRAPQLVKMFFSINSIFVEPYDRCKWSSGVVGPYCGDPPCSRNLTRMNPILILEESRPKCFDVVNHCYESLVG